MNISVLGLGNWGTAIANHLASKGYNVTGWTIEDQIVESINIQHKNLRYLPDILLNNKLFATKSLETAMKNEWIIYAVPSSAIYEVVESTKAVIKDKKIVSAVKGLAEEHLLTPSQLFLEHNKQIAVLGGPSFAKDLVRGKPVGVVIASKDDELSKEAANIFSNSNLKAYTSSDTIGAELGGAIKNVIAIAAGISDGLNNGESAKAGLITRGLAEMTRLGVALGANKETFSGLTGLGDLAMTATSDLSRNRVVGLRLGKGEKLDEILRTLGSTAEGVRSAPFILKLAEKFSIEMPITEAVNLVIFDKITPEEATKRLLTRPLKSEF